ncbi:zinc dependent phospholipase C family protein [Salidesulfovibrio brasiliensis]|uniref:zinc dependent phospholipase C family protein n=1 Tax=Salidesulfovibrio brasiliensis TaxID=221711 RepID=UPI0006CF7F93|nr:zinc dependent phospholipase C family protein [Salidesulfovibrio brasiliensis]
MPKEQLHFSIALKAAELGRGRVAEAARSHRDALLLGSVFHDILYYIRPGGKATCAGLADLFHGSDGMDSNTLLRLQLAHARDTDSRQALALLAGMASHACLDAATHPFIWYATGNYDDPDASRRSLARQRHRALETLLDMTYAAQPGRSTSLGRIQKELSPPLAELLPAAELARRCGADSTILADELDKALETYALVQRLSEAAPLAWLAYALWPLLPRSIREIAALLRSPQWLRQKNAVSGQIEYRSPVNGDIQQKSFSAMLDSAVEHTVSLWNEIEAVFEDEARLHAGKNLDTGMPSDRSQSMKHFREPPLIRLPGEE